MKYYFISFCLASMRLNQGFGQVSTPPKIDFIKDYPIKIDGGCSFYTYDTTALDRNSYIFIVGARNVGFISTAGKFILLKKVRRTVVRANQFKDYFAGQGYNITINMTEAGTFDNSNFLYTGAMILKYKNAIENFKIHGKVAMR